MPLPGALDQDQAANAGSLVAIDAATVVTQPDFTPERLAAEIAAGVRIGDAQRNARQGEADRAGHPVAIIRV